MRYLLLSVVAALCGCQMPVRDVSDGAETEPGYRPVIMDATIPQTIAASKRACLGYFGAAEITEREDGLDAVTSDRHVSIRISVNRHGFLTRGLKMYIVSHVSGLPPGSIEAGRRDVRGIVAHLHGAFQD